MYERPLVYLVPAAAAATFAAVCLNVSLAPSLTLVLAAVFLGLAGALTAHRLPFTLCCMLAAAAIALTGVTVYQRVFVSPVRELNGKHAEITATVLQDTEVYEDSQRAELSVDDNDVLPRSFKMYCYLPLTDMPLLAGDRIKVNVGFYLPSNTEGFDRAAYQAADGCYIAASYTEIDDDMPVSFAVTQTDNPSLRWLPNRIARFCKQAVTNALPTREAGLLAGLLIGDKNGITDDDTLSLRIAGLSHLVAVSGLHVGFLVAFCYLLFGRRLGTYLSVPLILLFVPIAGASPSVIRAAVMYLIAAGAFLTKREANTLNSLFAALALLLIQNPYAIASLSLQLSFSATLGLVLLAGKMQRKLLHPFRNQPKPVRKLAAVVAGALSCTVCATIFTAPILLSSFGYISVLSVLSNLAVVGVTAVAFIAGFLLCITSAIFPPAVPLFALVAKWPLTYILWVAERVSAIPFGMVDWGNGFGLAALAVFGAAVLLWLLAGNHIKWKLALPVIGVLLAGLSGASAYQYLSSYRVTYLPCGSGQAILVSDARQATLIDCAGDGGYRNASELVTEWMRMNGVSRIDTLILTAVDKGHARDLPALLETVEVGEIIIPSGCKETKNNADLLTLCAQQDAQSITEAQSIFAGEVPLTVFPVTDGKLGVQIAEEILVLHSPTQKQLAAFLETASVTAPEIVLSERNLEDEELLEQALSQLDAERLVVQAGFTDLPNTYCDLPVDSPYRVGELMRQYQKE